MATVSRNNYSLIVLNKFYGTSYISTKIYNAVKNDLVGYEVANLQEGQRLDQISGQIYGSSDYWWVISAASGIGWGLQVPAGTVIKIPSNLDEVLSIL